MVLLNNSQEMYLEFRCKKEKLNKVTSVYVFQKVLFCSVVIKQEWQVVQLNTTLSFCKELKQVFLV